MITFDDLQTKYGFTVTQRTPYAPFDHDVITVYEFENFKAEFCLAFTNFEFNGKKITRAEFDNKIKNRFEGEKLKKFPSYYAAIKNHIEKQKRLDDDYLKI